MTVLIATCIRIHQRCAAVSPLVGHAGSGDDGWDGPDRFRMRRRGTSVRRWRIGSSPRVGMQFLRTQDRVSIVQGPLA